MPTPEQRWNLKQPSPKPESEATFAAPGGSAFRWKVGTVQLFIVRDTPFLHTSASLPEYDVKRQVGSKWEREVVQWACDYLNARSNRDQLWEDDVKQAIKLGEQAVPYTPNGQALRPDGRSAQDSQQTTKEQNAND